MFHASRISSSIIAVIVCSVHIRFGLVWRCTVKADVFLHMEQGFCVNFRCWKTLSYTPNVRQVGCDDVTISHALLFLALPSLSCSTPNRTRNTWNILLISLRSRRGLSSVVKHLTQVLRVRSPANPTKNTKGRDLLILLRQMLPCISATHFAR